VTDNVTEQFKIPGGSLASVFGTEATQGFTRNNFAANVNWRHSFDTLGRELNIDLDYSKFRLDNTAHIVITQSNNSQSINDQTVNNPIQFVVFKLDYTHPLNKNSKFEAGLKSSVAEINNFLTFIRN